MNRYLVNIEIEPYAQEIDAESIEEAIEKVQLAFYEQHNLGQFEIGESRAVKLD